MVSLGGGKSKSELQTELYPGLFGEGMEGSPQWGTSKQIGNELLKMLTGGYKAEYSPAEQGFLSDIKTQTQGANTLRGLGPATESALATKLAPTMLDFQKQRMGGLLELGGLAMPQIVSGMKSSGKSSSGGVSY